jgi:hypothetical protein
MHPIKFLHALVFSFLIYFGNAQETDPWTNYMMPAEVHKNLEKYTGQFEMQITMWMMEGEVPVVIKVNSKNKMILGGRFLEMTQTGDMMGIPYHAISTLGYNNADKNYSLTTITNMGTGTLYVTGQYDHTSNSIQLRGILSNPVNDQMIEVRQVLLFMNDDQMMIENFDQEEGSEERKTIEYKFTRIKK